MFVLTRFPNTPKKLVILPNCVGLIHQEDGVVSVVYSNSQTAGKLCNKLLKKVKDELTVKSS